jgi:polygalacturonase
MFSGGYCSGGHGLSIGSVGGRSSNTVSDVTFENSQVVHSQQAVRIKTISGDAGTVSGITYRNIVFSDITKYGIVVDQAYNGVANQPTNGVSVTEFILSNVTGTVTSSGTNVYIDCGDGSCSNWQWAGVNVDGGKTSSRCKNVPSGISCS